MTVSLAWCSPKARIEFFLAAEIVPAMRQTTAKPKIAVTEQMAEPPLRRRTLLPAQAADELECGALTKPRTTT